MKKILLVFLAVFLFSCEEDIPDSLLGKWKPYKRVSSAGVETIYEPETVEIYNFKSNGDLDFIRYNELTQERDLTVSTEYKVDGNKLIIDQLAKITYSYQIDSDTLFLTRQNTTKNYSMTLYKER
jgi:hypothetical protein